MLGAAAAATESLGRRTTESHPLPSDAFFRDRRVVV